MALDPETRAAIQATRTVLKASARSLRTSLQFLAALEERLERETAQPEEAQRDAQLQQLRE